MKTWIKGGLIGGILGLILVISLKVSDLLTLTGESANSPIIFVEWIIIGTLMGFILGAIIGLIIQKSKEKK